MFRQSISTLVVLSVALFVFAACGGVEPEIESQTLAGTDRISDHRGDRSDQVRDTLSDHKVTDRRPSDHSDRRPSDVRIHDRDGHRDVRSDHRRHDRTNDHRLRDVHSARDFIERLRDRKSDHKRD